MTGLSADQRRRNMEVMLDRLHTTPREHLVAQLATACGDDEARAREIVDALDEYLADGPGRVPPMAVQSTTTDDLIAERDAALLRAEKAERELRELRAQLGTQQGVHR